MTYELALPMRGLVGSVGRLPTTWLTQDKLTVWLRSHVDASLRLRQGGGLVFSVQARDPWAAVEFAGERLDSLAARVMVGTPGRQSLDPIGRAYVAGFANPFPLDRPRRQVDVSALARAGVLLDHNLAALDGSLGAALELLALLEHSAPGGAVAGGWAAIEAVLSAGPNSVDAADELARLVACSFPRAELTTLAFRYAHLPDGAPRNDDVAANIRSAGTNREKCHVSRRSRCTQSRRRPDSSPRRMPVTAPNLRTGASSASCSSAVFSTSISCDNSGGVVCFGTALLARNSNPTTGSRRTCPCRRPI